MATLELFVNVYDEIQEYLLNMLSKEYEMDEYRQKYVREMMNVTMLGGKYNRGMCVVKVAEELLNSLPVTSVPRAQSTSSSSTKEDHLPTSEEAIKKCVLHDACVCGWMVELLQAHFLVEDDIMDKSTTRRGKPCWYLHPGVTTQVAINDGLILLAFATELSVHFFRNKPFLCELLRIFHRVDLTTTVGQFYDVTSMVDSRKLDAHVSHPLTTDFVEFTPFHYRRVIVYKTAYYTYWLPLQMGLLVFSPYIMQEQQQQQQSQQQEVQERSTSSSSSSQISSFSSQLTSNLVDPSLVMEISMLMGEYFQVQDDVMDCFTPPEKLGKVGTDIQDAKCSWLAVTFLAVATPAQIETFKANYGHEDVEKVAVIKNLYEETNLLQKFSEYEKTVVAKVTEMIDSIEKKCPAFARSVQALWRKTYKREK